MTWGREGEGRCAVLMLKLTEGGIKLLLKASCEGSVVEVEGGSVRCSVEEDHVDSVVLYSVVGVSEGSVQCKGVVHVGS